MTQRVQWPANLRDEKAVDFRDKIKREAFLVVHHWWKMSPLVAQGHSLIRCTSVTECTGHTTPRACWNRASLGEVGEFCLSWFSWAARQWCTTEVPYRGEWSNIYHRCLISARNAKICKKLFSCSIYRSPSRVIITLFYIYEICLAVSAD